MTSRRSFFGWLAGAAAAPAVAADALANTGGLARGGYVRGLAAGQHYDLFPEIGNQLRTISAEQAADVFRALRERDRRLRTIPPRIRVPHHYVRARAIDLPGMAEHVARQKRPRHRGHK